MLGRIVLGTMLILHGLIHLLSFVAYWNLAEVEGLSYDTSLLSGSLEVGEAGAWVFGLLWFVAAVGLAFAGAAVFLLRSWWRPLTLGAALLSLALTVLGWPDAWFGTLVNLVILAYLFVGGRRGWLPQSGAGTK